MAKRTKEPASAEEIVQAEQPVAQEPVAETGTIVPVAEPPAAPLPKPASGPSFGQRLLHFLGVLVRLVFVLLLGIVIGSAMYFGVYRRYVMPAEQNANQVRLLEARQTQSESAVADLQSRLASVEAAQVQQAQSLSDLNGRVTSLETEIAAHTKTLASLDEMQATLQSANEATSAEVVRQIKLLKSMELLSRARLFMYQSNFGLARQDVQTARDLLAEVQPIAPQPLADDLTAVLQRLDLTLTNLPNFPVAASDDLDIAWQVLLGGLPPAEPTPAPTLPPTPEATPTPQSTPEATATP